MIDTIHCKYCEERLSDFIDRTLTGDIRLAVEAHLSSCPTCYELLADLTGVAGVIEVGKNFPAYEPPVWLAARIIAHTNQAQPVSFRDQLSAIWKSLAEPRIALAIFTAAMVIGWFGGVTERQAILNKAESLVGCTYDRAVRSYFRSPVIIEIHSRFGQLLENS